MAKSKDHRLPAPLDCRKLEDIERRARAAFPDYRTAFPQEVRLNVGPKKGRLPEPGDASGFSFAYFLARCGLDADRFSREVMAEMIAGLLGVVDLAPTIEFYGFFQLPAGEGALERCQGSIIGATISSSGEYTFEFSPGGVVIPEERRERERRYAAERKYMEELNGKVIEAGRLPLRIASTGKSFIVEATGEARLHQSFSDEAYGVHLFRCSVPDASPRDLSGRFFDALEAVPVAAPVGYECRVQFNDRERGRADRCRVAYEFMRTRKWPASYLELQALFRLESAEALGGLISPFVGPRGVRLPLGAFKLGSKKGVKLFDLVKPDGHHLILQLPPEDQDQLPRIEWALGVTFAT